MNSGIVDGYLSTVIAIYAAYAWSTSSTTGSCIIICIKRNVFYGNISTGGIIRIRIIDNIPAYSATSLIACYFQYILFVVTLDGYSTASTVTAGNSIVLTKHTDNRIAIRDIYSRTVANIDVGIFQVNSRTSSSDIDRLLSCPAYDIGTIVADVCRNWLRLAYTNGYSMYMPTRMVTVCTCPALISTLSCVTCTRTPSAFATWKELFASK